MKPQPCHRLKCVAALALSACAGAQVSESAPQISPLSADMRAAMTGKSWKPGCLVPLDDLAAVQVTYLGFDGLTHNGTLVVHKRFAADASSYSRSSMKSASPSTRFLRGKTTVLTYMPKRTSPSASIARRRTTHPTNGAATPMASPLTSTRWTTRFMMPRRAGGRRYPPPWPPATAVEARFRPTPRHSGSSPVMAGHGAAFMLESRTTCAFIN
jgi:hypothetical protein